MEELKGYRSIVARSNGHGHFHTSLQIRLIRHGQETGIRQELLKLVSVMLSHNSEERPKVLDIRDQLNLLFPVSGERDNRLGVYH